MQTAAKPVTRHTKQSGFTLIELMIVVAIIGVLASIAVPQYQTYTGRAQAAEAFSATAGLRTDIALFYNENGNYPVVADDVGAGEVIDPTTINGQYITNGRVAVTAAGVINVPFDEGVHATETITLTPAETTGSIVWNCSSVGVPNDQLPSSCRP